MRGAETPMYCKSGYQTRMSQFMRVVDHGFPIAPRRNNGFMQRRQVERLYQIEMNHQAKATAAITIGNHDV